MGVLLTQVVLWPRPPHGGAEGPPPASRQARGRRLATGWMAGVLALAAPTHAHAQVIEVGPSGASLISGPAILTPEGRAPIRPAATHSGRPPSRSAAPPGVAPLLEDAGSASRLSSRLLEAVAYVESRFRHDAVSEKGAIGLMQLMPGTARGLNVDPADPSQNARGGAVYLREMLDMFGNDLELALAAYNAGPSAVREHGGVPPYAETRAYIAAVMDYLARTSLPETE